MNNSTIYFYGVNDAFGEFSNFAPYAILIDGNMWPTSEHYFQAKKFNNKSYREKIRKTHRPMEAARLGRSRDNEISPNWDTERDDVMRAALKAKFTQHAKLKSLLLSTGDVQLVERTANDSYWGDGGDGTGENKLGQLLVELREKLKGA